MGARAVGYTQLHTSQATRRGAQHSPRSILSSLHSFARNRHPPAPLHWAPNAGGELVPKATAQRRLSAVSSTAMLGQDSAGKTRYSSSFASAPGFSMSSSLHVYPT